MATVVSEPLVGRERELEEISAFIEDIHHGAASLLLEGEPGIGKTTLWRAGLDRAKELGYEVLEARPAEPEQELSFAALGDLLRDVHDDVGYLPDPQRRALRTALMLQDSAGDPPEQRAIAASLHGLLTRLADSAPVVIAVDDFQWLDSPSKAALQFAFRRLDQEPVRVLATSRAGVTELHIDEQLTVGSLSLQELDQLVRSRLHARFLWPVVRQLEQASGGNPFYAIEIAAALLRSGRTLEPGEPLAIPGTLRDVVRGRLALLSPTAREAGLATAALAQATVTVVQRATGDDLEPVAEAVSAGVLVREGETLRFTHPLLAATLYEDASEGDKKAMHRRLAGVVDSLEDRARHLAECAEGQDEDLAQVLEAAAVSVSGRGAPDVGAALAKRALELTPSELRLARHRRTMDWARLTAAAGDPSGAQRILEGHRDVAHAGREAAEVQLELGKARLATQGESAARSCFERALREVEGRDQFDVEASVLIELAHADFTAERLDLRASKRAIALAEKSRRDDLLARALGLHAAGLALSGTPPSEEFWQRAFEVERATGELRFGGPTGAYSLAMWFRGEFEESTNAELEIAESMRQRSDPLLPQVLLGICQGARISGDLQSAARYAQEAHDLVLQTGRYSDEPYCLYNKARIALDYGDVDAARAFMEEARETAACLPAGADERSRAEGMTSAALARIAEVSGQYDEAHELMSGAIARAEPLGPLMNLALAEMVAADVGFLVALGSVDDASRQLDRLIELQASARVPALDAITLRTEGLVTAARDEITEALRLLERSVEAFECLPSPWPMQTGWSLLALGRMQRRARHKQAARQTLQRALDLFERIGAKLWAEKARVELAQIGGRPSRPGALTETEKRVAELVAAGHSNAEVAHELFISPKTVEWNLSKIYRKLHVRSRTELAVKLMRRTASTR